MNAEEIRRAREAQAKRNLRAYRLPSERGEDITPDLDETGKLVERIATFWLRWFRKPTK
jgi:hypothetical protein